MDAEIPDDRFSIFSIELYFINSNLVPSWIVSA